MNCDVDPSLQEGSSVTCNKKYNIYYHDTDNQVRRCPLLHSAADAQLRCGEHGGAAHERRSAIQSFFRLSINLS